MNLLKRPLRLFLVLFLVYFINSPSSAQTSKFIGESKTELLFILDVSGSMNGILEGGLLIDWAKKAIIGAVSTLPEDAEIGLRAYGHRVEQKVKAASCIDSELLVPIGRGNGSLVTAAVHGLKPKGWTPIAYSLEQAASDFGMRTERLHTIILVSDGEETCGGDPLAAARSLIDKGFRIKIFTIGFNVDAAARNQLQSLATEFGGTYTDVRSGARLQDALVDLTQKTFLVKKKDVENRLRGGDNPQSAVPIETNKKYRLDHHQKMEKYDYFSVTLSPGQEVSLHVVPMPRCLKIVGNQMEEKNSSICNPEGFRFVLQDKTGRELLKSSSSLIDQPNQTRWIEIAGKGPETFYLVAGSPRSAMHRDNEFQISSREYGDAGAAGDAGDSFSTAMVIGPGVYENNRVSPADEVDLFKVQVSANSAVKIAVTLSPGGAPDQRISFQVLGEVGELLSKTQELLRGGSGVVELRPQSSAQSIYIRVQKTWGSKRPRVYTLGVSIKEVASAPVPKPAVLKTVPPPPPEVKVIPPPKPHQEKAKPAPVQQTVKPTQQKTKGYVDPLKTDKRKWTSGWLFLVTLLAIFGVIIYLTLLTAKFFERRRKKKVEEADTSGDVTDKHLDRPKRYRGFTQLLYLIIIINMVFLGVVTFSTILIINLLPLASILLIVLSVSLYIADIIFAAAILKWKRWGVYGFVAIPIMFSAWDLLQWDFSLIRVIFSVLSLALVLSYVRPTWRYME